MNAKKTKRLEDLKQARTEIDTTVEEARIQRALQSELPPATRCLILPGDLVTVYEERTAKCEERFTLTKVSKKIISITDVAGVKPFNQSLGIPITQKTNDTELKYDMENIQEYVQTNDQHQHYVRLLKSSYWRTITKLYNDAIKTRLQVY